MVWLVDADLELGATYNKFIYIQSLVYAFFLDMSVGTCISTFFK